jgi:glycogen debranching enzyme
MKNLLLGILFLLTSDIFSQELVCDCSDYNEAFKLAVNTININVRRGILAAGGDYGGEWARDISINSWNAESFFNPVVAENSLWSVTKNKDSVGHQYWDHIIWVPAALNHFYITGNMEFLKQARICSSNTMENLEKTTFDEKYGLFMGPSVFNDGIAGYPAPIYDSANNSSYVLDHTNSVKIKCLSTNCVYYGAYLALINMEKEPGGNKQKADLYKQKAARLKTNILKYFYNKNENKLYYLIDHLGNTDKSQEGLGLSFAVIFGILNSEQAVKVVNNAAVSKFGVTSIYPDFSRYSLEKPGRHNNLIWPMVNGFFAQAAAKINAYKVYEKELNGLTNLALDKDKGNFQFWEIYNPNTGKPDGGWQSGRQWNSCRYQTWSATAYANMVLYGLAGIRIEKDGILFSPYMPQNLRLLTLRKLRYRNFDFEISIAGSGNKIKTFSVNGQKLDAPKLKPPFKNTIVQIEME